MYVYTCYMNMCYLCVWLLSLYSACVLMCRKKEQIEAYSLGFFNASVILLFRNLEEKTDWKYYIGVYPCWRGILLSQLSRAPQSG